MNSDRAWRVIPATVVAVILSANGVAFWIVALATLGTILFMQGVNVIAHAMYEHLYGKEEQAKPFENRAARREKPIRSRDNKAQRIHKDWR